MNGCSGWMCGAIRLHRPTHQQQAQHHAQHELLLFRQRIHCPTLASLVPPCNYGVDWGVREPVPGRFALILRIGVKLTPFHVA